MRVLLTLLYLSLFLGTTAQKLKYIHFKGPEGARLYLSKQRPFVIEDSIHNLTGTTYLGTTKGTAALASNRFPSSYGTNYLIVEKQGYKVSISKLNLQRVDKVNYKVSGVLGEKIQQRNEDELFLLPGEINVSSTEKKEYNRLISDPLSHNYGRSAYNQQEEEQDISFLESVVRGITASTLDKKGYLPSGNFSSFSRYKSVAKIDVSLLITDVSRPTYYSSARFSYKITTSIVDHFGNQYVSIADHFSTSNAKEILGHINKMVNKTIDNENFKNLKATIDSTLSTTKSKWELLHLSQKHPATNKKEVGKSVVSVITEKGHGSGVIIDESGYIISNYHVVVGQDNVKIKTHAEDTIIGKVIRANPLYDLALIKCDTSFQHSVQLDITSLTAGHEVSSVGSPLSVSLSGSISKGIVVDRRDFNDISFYQVNCSVNPGNSGGALIDQNNHLLGIINAKLVGHGVSKLGFAIPTNYIFEGLKVSAK